MNGFSAADMTDARAKGYQDRVEHERYTPRSVSFDGDPAAPVDVVRARLHEIAYRDSAVSVTVRAEDLRAILAAHVAAAPTLNDELVQDRMSELSKLERDVLDSLPAVYYMDPPDGGDVSLGEQVKRMAEDAALWRKHVSTPGVPVTDEQYADADALIAHLDELMDDGGQGGEKWEPAQAAIAGIRAWQSGTPAAPGIDLIVPERIKQAHAKCGLWPETKWPGFSPDEGFMALLEIRNWVETLIDASPKGGSDAKDATRYRHLRTIDAVGATIGFDWTCGDGTRYDNEYRDANVDASMQATSAEVGA